MSRKRFEQRKVSKPVDAENKAITAPVVPEVVPDCVSPIMHEVKIEPTNVIKLRPATPGRLRVEAK